MRLSDNRIPGIDWLESAWFKLDNGYSAWWWIDANGIKRVCRAIHKAFPGRHIVELVVS
jgi:hypothetical protein